MSKFQLRFDVDSANSDLPNLEALKAFVHRSLKCHKLNQIYRIDDIIDRACHEACGITCPNSCSGICPQAQEAQSIEPYPIIEIQAALIKTFCLEIIEKLSREHGNKQKFNLAVTALFDDQIFESRAFWMNIIRTLKQYRLSGTYDAKEIIAEAYARGIKLIESGEAIDNPLPWMRRTCLNVIRELRRKQNQADDPKLDPSGLMGSDVAWSRLIQDEDIRLLCLALQQLSPKDQELLCLHYIENHSWQEIADLLSRSSQSKLNANAARQRGHRALRALRRHYINLSLNGSCTDRSAEQPEGEESRR